MHSATYDTNTCASAVPSVLHWAKGLQTGLQTSMQHCSWLASVVTWIATLYYCDAT